MNFKWSNEALAADAARFTTRTAWARASSRAYNAAQSRGLLDVCCSHMKPKVEWTFDAIKLDAAKYDSVKAWSAASPSAYVVASKRGWLSDVSTNMRRERTARTDEEIIAAARKFDSRSAWEKSDPNTYSVAKSRKLLDRACAHMGALWRVPTTEEWIDMARTIHGAEYDYSRVIYKRAHDAVEIICPKHGSFWQTPNNHISGAGSRCPTCVGFGPSRAEREIFEFIKALCPDAEQSVRTVLGNTQELDIVVPSRKIAVELNGLIWHSEKYGKDRAYHQHKSDAATVAGYRLLHIWEDEWRDKRAWCEAFFRMQLVGPERKVFARTCELRKIDFSLARDFHNTYHLQGYRNGEHVGLFHKDELVAVATVRGNELSRWCVKFDMIVVGGLSRAVAWFDKSLFSFCDTAKHVGTGYLGAGFTLDSMTPPTYFYTDGKQRINRMAMQRHKLNSNGATEKDKAASLGLYQVGGCRQLKFVSNQQENH